MAVMTGVGGDVAGVGVGRTAVHGDECGGAGGGVICVRAVIAAGPGGGEHAPDEQDHDDDAEGDEDGVHGILRVEVAILFPCIFSICLYPAAQLI